MRRMTHDMRAGSVYALLSALTFGFSGTLARPLLEAGWSPAAVVIVRAFLAGVVLCVPAAIALRGRWALLRESAGLILAYGLIVVAFTQFAYYSAISHMAVAVALMVEYVAPVVVLGWLWLRHAQRPTPTTALGAGVAIAGLLLVLGLFSGVAVSFTGMVWALGAMSGCVVYFILSARPSALPATVLVGGGLISGAGFLAAAGLVGLVPLRANLDPVHFRGVEVPFWLPLIGVALIATASAYVLGVAAGRRLGARLASFFALLEVLAAVAISWVLLGQQPHAVHYLGGLGILGGVVLVKLGERTTEPEVIETSDLVPLAA